MLYWSQRADPPRVVRRKQLKYLMQPNTLGYNRKSPRLPQTDAMKEEYMDNRPPWPRSSATSSCAAHSA
eukprot:43840-Eustigmatos_ZCMA.PRE.1